MGRLAVLAAALLAVGMGAEGAAAAQRFDGVKLSLASMNDQYSGPLVKLAPRAKADLGIDVNVDILSYPELLTKITADFVGGTKGYDLVTMDIVWAGQFEEAGHTVVLNDLIERDKAELGLDDIYPVLFESLGSYDGKQVAYPFAGYANVLAYRKDLYDAAGLQPPKTIDELAADAKRLTDKGKSQYGFVANGQKGPGGGAGLDAVQRPARRLDPGPGRQARDQQRRQRREPQGLQAPVRRVRPARCRRVRLGRARGELPPGPRRQHAELVGRAPPATATRRCRRSSARPASRSPR